MEEINDVYKIIKNKSEGFYKDKGSKFYAFAIPVNSEEEVKEEVEKLKKEYYDARHHCYAYVLGVDKKEYRINDDGEPSGTAGQPIYGQILSYDVINVLIVVVRYFGGTKLGVRGLINAYKTAASEALNNAEIISQQVQDVYKINFEYPQMNKVMYIIKEENLVQLDQTFEISCEIIFAVRKKESQRIFEKFKSEYPLTIKYLKTV